MPFERSAAERRRATIDTTPWKERALAVQRSGSAEAGHEELLAEGTLLEVMAALLKKRPAELRTICVSLPDRRQSGRTFEGPALINLLAQARLLVKPDSDDPAVTG